MDGEAKGKAVPTYLWRGARVVPIVKVDKGLAEEKDGVSLMKRYPILTSCSVGRANSACSARKMRSVINLASKTGIAAIAKQQFEIGEQIASRGLTPILEPEVSIKSPDKAGAERILLDELTKGLDALPAGRKVMLKLTIPETPTSTRVDQGQAGRARRCAVRRLYAGRRLRTSRQESRHDRELLARAGRRP